MFHRGEQGDHDEDLEDRETWHQATGIHGAEVSESVSYERLLDSGLVRSGESRAADPH